MTSNKPVTVVTWIGLVIALFGLLIVRWAAALFHPGYGLMATLWRESLIWLCVVVLLLVIRRGERLPFSSVGIGTSTWKMSILWGIVITVLCILVGAVIATLTHFTGGPASQAFGQLPIWLVTLVVLRAGVVEELFYRGYAIERLQLLGLNRYCAAAIPLVIFGLGHAINGWANVVIALALGAILAAFYLWRRDLVANMIGHFMVDFVFNVLPRLFPHSGHG